MRLARLLIATSPILSVARPAICDAESGNKFADRQQAVINHCPILEMGSRFGLCADPAALPAITDFGEL